MVQSGAWGSVSMAPTMAGNPRGSSSDAVRIQSCFAFRMSRFSASVVWGRSGTPLVMTLVGSPPVWESMIFRNVDGLLIAYVVL